MMVVRRFFIILFVALPLLAGPSPERPWLGIRFSWLPEKDGHRVVQVQNVAKGGPAEKAGVRAGDVLVKVNRLPVDFGDDLEFLLFLAEQKPGGRMSLGIVREGKPLTIVVTLGVLPEAARAGWEASLERARRARQQTQTPRQ